MSSARRLYRLHLGLASVGLTGVVTGLIVALSRIDLGRPSTGALLAACRRIVPSEPGLALLVLSLGLLGLVVLTLATRSLARQLRGQHQFLERLTRSDEARICGHRVVVVEGIRPEAFCAGFLHPRIYVSAAALQRLSEAELRAVMAHEAHHQSSHDPLRILLAAVLADALFFLPGLSQLSLRYRQLAELAADEAATQAEGAGALASALLIFGERSGPTVPVVGIAPERVDHLLGQSPGWQLPISAFVGSLVILAALLGLAFAAPTLVGSENLSMAAMLSELCMVGMVAAPLAILAALPFRPSGRLRLRLLDHR